LIALGAAIALTGCTKKNGVAATGNAGSAVVTVAQLAPARPDAGVPGNGTALPAITTAVLGGVAITGGIGRVAGVVLATLLIVWLNAGILPAFVGNERSQCSCSSAAPC
jgi:ribose/xylose/arabinose/galactoside ABC-type transport system permease subunit